MASVFLAVVVVSGCSDAAGESDQASPPTRTNTIADPIKTKGQATGTIVLTIPHPIRGEVSRTTLRVGGTDTPSTTTIVADPVKGRPYVVRSACTARGEASITIAYRLVDARAVSANLSPEQRTVMSAHTPCDGQQHIDAVGSLLFPVTVDYDRPAFAVETAYSVVAPG